MMITFWDKDGVLLTEYLPHGITINGPYFASSIERLRSLILEKRSSKVSGGVLVLHDNVPIHMSNIVQTTIRQPGFIELNQPAYSPDIAPTAEMQPVRATGRSSLGFLTGRLRQFLSDQPVYKFFHGFSVNFCKKQE